jgi:hypothetical protein
VHKAVSPSTYACHLCRLTYGLVREKREWRAFVESLPLAADFLHRDEFRRLHPAWADVDLPTVLVADGDDIRLLVPAGELDAAAGLDELCRLVEARVGALLG